jgi:hypothetical protein
VWILDWYGSWMHLVLDAAHAVPMPLAYYTTVPGVLLGMALPLAAAFYVLCIPFMIRGAVYRKRYPDLPSRATPEGLARAREVHRLMAGTKN